MCFQTNQSNPISTNSHIIRWVSAYFKYLQGCRVQKHRNTHTEEAGWQVSRSVLTWHPPHLKCQSPTPTPSPTPGCICHLSTVCIPRLSRNVLKSTWLVKLKNHFRMQVGTDAWHQKHPHWQRDEFQPFSWHNTSAPSVCREICGHGRQESNDLTVFISHSARLRPYGAPRDIHGGGAVPSCPSPESHRRATAWRKVVFPWSKRFASSKNISPYPLHVHSSMGKCCRRLSDLGGST